ncbi:MAG: uncharacterized protein KVP18_004082 [Porospora cf. gigantea A]|uniref:uncharacterized protein n=1 Tax=Porospora cf. gigantea A TaxID=2853593 RepID=UPI00355A8CD4|nr:MAG: hypothetical protein KVP18_004082 [Porospora cf. gigantea A]
MKFPLIFCCVAGAVYGDVDFQKVLNEAQLIYDSPLQAAKTTTTTRGQTGDPENVKALLALMKLKDTVEMDRLAAWLSGISGYYSDVSPKRALRKNKHA